MIDDMVGSLIHDQRLHIVGYKIVGVDPVDITLVVGDARPYRKLNNRRDQPVKQIHQQVGAVLPLLGPIYLPQSLKDKNHGISLCHCEDQSDEAMTNKLLIKRLLDNIFNGWVSNRNVMNRQISQ